MYAGDYILLSTFVCLKIFHNKNFKKSYSPVSWSWLHLTISDPTPLKQTLQKEESPSCPRCHTHQQHVTQSSLIPVAPTLTGPSLLYAQRFHPLPRHQARRAWMAKPSLPCQSLGYHLGVLLAPWSAPWVGLWHHPERSREFPELRDIPRKSVAPVHHDKGLTEYWKVSTHHWSF